MHHPWWATVLQWAVGGIVMAVVMGWVARSRHRKRPESEARRLAHPPSTLLLGLAGFAFFSGIAVLSNVHPNETTTLWTTAVFTGFAVLSLILVADYFLARHVVTEDGMGYGRLTGRRGSLRWSQVVRVRYTPTMKWFELRTQAGEVARVSALLIGLPVFARMVLAHVPPDAIDPETAAVLQATAAGEPPAVWG